MASDQQDLHHSDHDNYTRENAPPEIADVGVDDFALENAIGDAFQQFGLVPERTDKEETSHPVEEAEINNEAKQQNVEVDLEAAVGNAFHSLETQLASENQDYEESKEGTRELEEGTRELKGNYNQEDQEHQYSQDHGLGDEDHNQDQTDHIQDLNTDPDQDQYESPYQDHSKDQFSKEQEYSYPLQAEKSEDELGELDLEAAIGNAFKSITNQPELHLENQPELQLENQPEPQLENIEEQEHAAESVHEHHSVSHSPEDDKLENAIGEAFKSLSEYAEPHVDHEQNEEQHYEQPDPQQENAQKQIEQNAQQELSQHHFDDGNNQDHDLSAAITASFDDIMGNKQAERRQSEVGLDLAGIVQNVVQQMAGSTDTEEPTENERKEIPHLDENVVAHFQMEANNDEEVSTLKDVIATAARNVMGKTVTEEDDTDQPEQDLEKLQMNEILQNAFTMAMLNPQELLTSLNDDESKASPSRSQNLSTAAAIAALSMKKALEKRDVSQPEKSTADMSASGPAKSLSIAETLALHRSSMSNAPRRDYSSIQSLEESIRADPQRMPTMNPQLSNILSSLSHHIQSGNQSQSLMLVIRQMTNALMLNKTSSVVSTTAQDLLQEAKNRPEERTFFMDSLSAAKSFLSDENAGDLTKRAVTLIDNVIGLLNEKEPVVEFHEGVQTDKAANLSEFYQSTLSTLSGFSSSRVRSILAGIKPEHDSSEYKEKIRIDNRERKKKWREENAERNKDNDLRSRVIKRANNMFGEESTPEKRAWIEEEFNKRREKRLAKQKKGDLERPLNRRDSDTADSKPLVSAYAEDPKLVKRVTDIFSLVAETGLDDDPQTILEATSAATAVAASTYAKSLGITDGKPVQSAVTQILTNLVDSTVRSGAFMRIPFLSKVHNVPRTSVSKLPENSDLMDRLSSLTGVDNADGQKSAFEILQSSRKRLGLEFLTSDFKKPRAEQEGGLFLEKDRSSISRIESEIDQLRTSISSTTSSHLWNATNGLKMPQYKKPDTKGASSVIKRELPSPSLAKPALSKPSPFISNKVGLSGSTTPTASVGLRKPGSFQRPAYSKLITKTKSSGFPTLYSPSFKLK